MEKKIYKEQDFRLWPTADKLKKGNSVSGSRYCYVYLFESDWNLSLLN